MGEEGEVHRQESGSRGVMYLLGMCRRGLSFSGRLEQESHFQHQRCKMQDQADLRGSRAAPYMSVLFLPWLWLLVIAVVRQAPTHHSVEVCYRER